MPIINKNVQVVFGTGDIGVRIGSLKDRSSGIIQFEEIKPRPIGEKFTPERGEFTMDEAPVALIFNKVESLDAVIYQLQKLRDIMSEEGKYDWSESGMIVEKNDK